MPEFIISQLFSNCNTFKEKAPMNAPNTAPFLGANNSQEMKQFPIN